MYTGMLIDKSEYRLIFETIVCPLCKTYIYSDINVKKYDHHLEFFSNFPIHHFGRLLGVKEHFCYIKPSFFSLVAFLVRQILL